MGYRKNDIPPKKPEDTLPRFEVRNGAILDLAFPCYYLDVVPAHDWHYHDHIGWPAPNYPGEACQQLPHIKGEYKHGEWEYIDFNAPTPIHLTSAYEGYDSAYVVFDALEDKPQDFRFTLFVHAPARTYQGKQQYEKSDQVIRGIITVLPGTIYS